MKYLALLLIFFSSTLFAKTNAVNTYLNSYPKLSEKEDWVSIIKLGEEALNAGKIASKKKALIHADLASTYFYLGNYATGEIHTLSSLDLSESLKCKDSLIRSLYLLSAHKRAIGNTENKEAFIEAQTLIEKALHLIDSKTSVQLKGKVYFNAGAAYADDPKGNLELAVHYYSKAISCFQKSHHIDSSHRSSIRLGKALLLKGDVDASIKLADDIQEQECSLKTLTHLLYLKAQISIEDAQLKEAKKHIKKGIKIASEQDLTVEKSRFILLKEENNLY
jgi:tetratricopeptide (TPR) repeat protein